EIHHDCGIDFDGFSVKQSWTIAPLADGFDGRTSKVWISLAVYDAKGQRLAVDSNDGMKNHAALRAGGPGGIGINRHYLVEKFCSLDFSAEANSSRISSV